MKTIALIMAAGLSRRFDGSVPKQFVKLCGQPVLAHTINRFERAETVDAVIIVTTADRVEHIKNDIVKVYKYEKVIDVVVGGESRQESVRLGLQAIPDSFDLVAIQDGARIMTRSSDIDKVNRVAQKTKAAMLAIPMSDTVKRVNDMKIIETVDRADLFLAQTPQVFEREAILSAHLSNADSKIVTDDASLVEQSGTIVTIVVPEYPNPKITTKNDFEIIELILRKEKNA